MKQVDALKILKAGKNVYLTGPAGSGKTYIVKEYISYLTAHGVNVALTASTGIAATHIGGTTIHSWSGMGIKDSLSEMHIDSLTEKEYLWKRYQKTEVLIIDEVSMMSASMFDSLDRLCCAMRRNNNPFGGMQIILSGDFFQLPPIARQGEQADFIYNSRAWRESDIRICYLSEQHRQENDDALGSILAEMRSGEVSEETGELLRQHSEDHSLGDFVPTKLFTHNKDVDSVNDVELDKLPGDAEEYYMDSKGKANLVDSIKKGLLAPEILRLKIDAVVMFVKNNFDVGYVNGTLGVVERFEEGLPVVRTFSGDEIKVEATTWRLEENDKVLAEVSQLPLRLAWAITIHKSQGMTLDAAEIDLSNSFVPGQGYVAMSRVRSMDGLILKGMNNVAFMVHPEVLKYDSILKRESNKWEEVIKRFDETQMKQMHDDFIVSRGGTLDPDEIAKNKSREKQIIKEKISTVELTKQLVMQRMAIEDIAREREMTVGTIVGHLEKLRHQDKEIDLDYLRPLEKHMKKIQAAFEKTGGLKLSPVHAELEGEFDFEELKIARLFVEGVEDNDE